MAVTIIGIGVIFFLGHALDWFFTKTKIPDLLILVTLGFFLGPLFGVLDASDFGKVGAVLSTIALVVILYEGGLHLSARDLLTSSLPAAGISLLGFGFIVAAGTFVSYAIALQPLPISILLGIGIGSTSSAIVMPMVKKLSVSDKTKAVLSLESAFTDVLTIVIFLVLTDSIAANQFEATDLLVGIGPNTLMAALIGLFSGLTWAFVNKRFADLIPKAFASEAWALLTYGVLEVFGLNGAIGVLALGFMLANLDLQPGWMRRHCNENTIKDQDTLLLAEITFLLRTFFFLYLGLLIKFSDWRTVAVAILLTGLIFVTRYIAVRILFRGNSGFPRLDAMISAAMGPRGLACAVLATIPLSKGIEGAEWLRDTMFALIPLTILVTAVMVTLSEKDSYRQRTKLFAGYPDDEADAKTDAKTDAEAALESESKLNGVIDGNGEVASSADSDND